VTPQNIELGDRVQDRITGVKGIVIGYTYWLYGCERVILQPETLHDGRPVDTVQIDADQVTIVKKGAVHPVSGLPSPRRAGSRPNVQRSPEVRRR